MKSKILIPIISATSVLTIVTCLASKCIQNNNSNNSELMSNNFNLSKSNNYGSENIFIKLNNYDDYINKGETDPLWFSSTLNKFVTSLNDEINKKIEQKIFPFLLKNTNNILLNSVLEWLIYIKNKSWFLSKL